MNFQVTVLKVLVSYPDGFAVMEDIKRDLAILATRTHEAIGSPRDRPGYLLPSLIERMNGGWRITDKGRAILEIMEARPAPAQATELANVRAVEEPTLTTTLSPMPSIAPRRMRKRSRRQRDAIRRRQATSS